MGSKLIIQLLGAFQIAYGDKPLTGFESSRLQALLAYLLLHRNAPQTRQHIAFKLYPDSTEAQARTNLRGLLYTLRQELPNQNQFLEIEKQILRWRSDTPFSLDVDEF